MDVLEYKPLGLLRSCFKEKNGTPRQGLHAPHSRASLTLNPSGCYYVAGALEGLTDYSHVWLIFDFHANTNKTDSMIKAKIKAPQLGGKATGLFATRTPHRPNPIGLSLCILESVNGNTITLRGVDLIEGTPILDVKPYHPMDCMVDAEYPQWVAAQFPDRRAAPQIVPPLRAVEFTDAAAEELRLCLEENSLELYSSVEEVREGMVECIRLDMRREQHRKKLGAGSGTFRFCFDLLNVTFKMTAPDAAIVTSVEYWPLGKAAHFDAAKHVVPSPSPSDHQQQQQPSESSQSISTHSVPTEVTSEST